MTHTFTVGFDASTISIELDNIASASFDIPEEIEELFNWINSYSQDAGINFTFEWIY